MKSNYRTINKDIDNALVVNENFAIKQQQGHTRITQLIEQWVETKRSTQTRRAYRRDVQDFCDHIGLVTTRDLEIYSVPVLSNQFLQWLKSHYQFDEYHQDKIINATTINRKAYAVSSFFEFLMAVYQYPKNPTKIYTSFKTPKHSTTQSLTKGEFITLLEHQKQQYVSQEPYTIEQLKELRDYCMLGLMGISLRRNEVAKLTRGDIDHTTPHLKVYQKGGSIKLIPLPSSLYDSIIALKKCKESLFGETLYIFSPVRNNSTGITDKPISTDYIFSLIKKLVGLCGIDKNITPHSLRKTFIELALDNKQDYINIANATGHSTLEMIKYYDTRSKLEKNAINGMDIFD